jgi:AAA domain
VSAEAVYDVEPESVHADEHDDELSRLGERPISEELDIELVGPSTNGNGRVKLSVAAAPGRLASQPWRAFAGSTPAEIDWLVPGLIARAAFVFIAAPPKKGKTWVVIDLALAVTLGRPFLALFEVETAQPVLLVMLEGHRAAVRDRIGAMARGAGIDPDGDELERLHISYKPPGINLSDPGWAADLRAEAADVKAALVAVDVLRAAARLKHENSGDDFAILRDNLRPLGDDGRACALTHHFGKLTELSKERTPGERMTGSGALYGAMDFGVFITGSESGARVLRVEFDGRDSAMPDPIGVRLLGAGSGTNGSLLYADAAHFVAEHAPDAAELKAPAADIAAWIRQERGGHATPTEIREAFDISEDTLRRRRDDLAALGIAYISAGRLTRYEDLGDPLDPATANPATSRVSTSRGQNPHGQATPPRDGRNPATEPIAGSDSAQPSQNSHPANPALPTGAVPASRDALPSDDDIPF